mmetsp:Transcript_36932/g.96645  ORF Transcript_36932/g.96645 Transcript_36932/m.96645 type:complete len:219 (+) Transcript_36932:1389-2045(+)
MVSSRSSCASASSSRCLARRAFLSCSSDFAAEISWLLAWSSWLKACCASFSVSVASWRFFSKFSSIWSIIPITCADDPVASLPFLYTPDAPCCSRAWRSCRPALGSSSSSPWADAATWAIEAPDSNPAFSLGMASLRARIEFFISAAASSYSRCSRRLTPAADSRAFSFSDKEPEMSSISAWSFALLPVRASMVDPSWEMWSLPSSMLVLSDFSFLSQ